jgi:hypothetical protein
MPQYRNSRGFFNLFKSGGRVFLKGTAILMSDCMIKIIFKSHFPKNFSLSNESINSKD